MMRAFYLILLLFAGFKLPAMGWSALYGAPFGAVNETIVAVAAEGLKSSGLLAAGYAQSTHTHTCSHLQT